MRLESSEPKNESQFYTSLRDKTLGNLFSERVEPSNESGFPDINFVLRDGTGEGTIELKYADTREPNLRSLCRGTQKAALLEYSAAGGRRRFALCYCNGQVFAWNTEDFRFSIRTDGRHWTSVCDWDDPQLAQWLYEFLTDWSYAKL